MDTKTKKNIKKPTLSLVNAGPPDRVSVLSTKCGECHLKGFTVASLYKIKIIIMTILLLTRQFSFLLDIRTKID